jgi:hypothetical protein
MELIFCNIIICIPFLWINCLFPSLETHSALKVFDYSFLCKIFLSQNVMANTSRGLMFCVCKSYVKISHFKFFR